MKTVVEFRLVCGLARVNDRLIATVDMASVPLVGERVSVEGKQYVVHERSWAVLRRDDDDHTYAYLRIWDV